MTSRTPSFLSDPLFQASGWLFVAFMVANLFSYGFQVAMGRLLLPQEYGFLNSLLGICVMLSVPISTVLMAVSRGAAQCKAHEDFAGIRSLFEQAHWRILSTGFLGLLVFLLGARYLANYLHSASVIPLIIFGLFAYASLAVPINTALLQGLQDYKWLGIATALGGSFRFFFCIALVLAGFGVNGVLAGLVLTSAAAWLTAYVPIRKHLARGRTCVGNAPPLALTQMWPVFLVSLGFTVMTQSDIILVTRYFPSQEAGMYAAAAILGRSVLYIPAAFVQAMFPMVSEHHALNLDSRHLLTKSLAATLIFSGFGAVLFFLFPGLVISVFFSPRYLAAAPVLRCLGPAMLPMALLMVLINYSIAKGERFFAYALTAGAILEIVGISFWHGSLRQVVFVMMTFGTLQVAVGLLRRRWRA